MLQCQCSRITANQDFFFLFTAGFYTEDVQNNCNKVTDVLLLLLFLDKMYFLFLKGQPYPLLFVSPSLSNSSSRPCASSIIRVEKIGEPVGI